MATIHERYATKFAKSAEWGRRGRPHLPGGISHHAQFDAPFPHFIEHAAGPFVYDVDGNRIIDFVMGNGSLIMGHSPPEVVAAMKAQAERGTLLGGATVIEVHYAKALKALMPSLERVRFTNSGTESSYLAVRLARAYTGRTTIVKLRDHFHGWDDHMMAESGQSLGGVPRAALDSVIVCPADISEVSRVLSENDDIAGVIVEAHGARYGTFPLPNPQFLADVRDITSRHGVVFILDEVITGFRLSTGGAQVRWSIQPDLTTMGGVMGGGQTGGAVGGKSDIMELMAYKDDSPDWNQTERVAQGGTYNANPVPASAAIATLKAIAAEPVNARADALAQRLKDGLNQTFTRNGVKGHAHGVASIIHANPGADCDCDREVCTMPYEQIRSAVMPPQKTRLLRQAMLLNGVAMMGQMGGPAFMVSSAHSEELIDQSVDAFSQALKDLGQEGAL
jgi:glutamate-1-semialdehyde 2,1-aminomutase